MALSPATAPSCSRVFAPPSASHASPPPFPCLHGFPRSPAPKRNRPCGRVGCGADPEDQASASIPDSLPLAGVDTDWRDFRARLVATSRSGSAASGVEDGRWAHAVHAPETGCLLVAHPLMFSQSQTYFSQAVIFIFTHSESGSAGLILNRPTEFTLGKVAGAEEMCPEFAESQLRLGGDVGKSTLNILHSYGELEGAIEIVNGIYLGGFEAARRAVREGNAQGKDFTWFMHHAGWGPGQLENECSSGVWFTAAAGRDLILQPRDGNDAPADMWHEVLQLMGGEYSELSKVVQQPYRADIMGNEGREGEDV